MTRQMVRDHFQIVIVLVLFIALGIVYGVTTPLFEAPDEQWHFAFVQHVATGRGLPVQVEPLTHLARQEGSQPPLYYLLAAGATFWIDTSDFPGLVWENPHYGYNVPGIVNDNKNLFIHTSLENFPYRGAVLAMRLARLLSVLIGALAVLFTYLLALEIFSTRKFLAASAAVVVAFVPQFVFVSSAVSNDSTIVAATALSLWLMARLLNAGRRMPDAGGQRSAISGRAALALGVMCGLAALAKVSGLGLFVLAAFVLSWQALRQSKIENQKSKTLICLALFVFAFLLVAGWWYARNLVLYGELTGTARMNEIFHLRAAPMSLDQLLVQLREVWETFWVGLGWGNIRALPIIYMMIAIFVALGVIGWTLGIRNSPLAIRHSPFVILLAWIALMVTALVYWMQTTQAPHGRLFFPALPALAILLVFGLEQFSIFDFRLPMVRLRSSQVSRITHHASRFTHLSHLHLRAVQVFAHLSFVIFLFALAALTPFALLQPAYAFPPTLSESAIPQIPNRVDILYDDEIKLLGYDVSARQVSPGDAIELTLYWQALAPLDQDYSIGIRVLDSDQHVIGARNSYPGHGMLPTRLWSAGQIIRDVYWLPINADAPDAPRAQLQIVVFERLSKRDLVARDPRGEIITPFIGQIEIAPK